MGRPKTYSRDEALVAMSLVFWRKGFQATSLSDLEAATGVNRRSLVNDFGSKEAMFRESLAHYVEIKAKPDGAPLAEEPPSPDNVRRFFRNIRYREEAEWGCLFALTLLEEASAPPEARAFARAAYEQLEQAFVHNLLPAVADGRLPDRASAERLAAFLLNTLYGIIVGGRAGRTNEELRRIVDVALSLVPS